MIIIAPVILDGQERTAVQILMIVLLILVSMEGLVL